MITASAAFVHQKNYVKLRQRIVKRRFDYVRIQNLC